MAEYCSGCILTAGTQHQEGPRAPRAPSLAALRPFFTYACSCGVFLSAPSDLPEYSFCTRRVLSLRGIPGNEMCSSPFTAPTMTGQTQKECPALLGTPDKLPGGQTEGQVRASQAKRGRAHPCARLRDPLQALKWSGWPAPLGLSEEQGGGPRGATSSCMLGLSHRQGGPQHQASELRPQLWRGTPANRRCRRRFRFPGSFQPAPPTSPPPPIPDPWSSLSL